MLSTKGRGGKNRSNVLIMIRELKGTEGIKEGHIWLGGGVEGKGLSAGHLLW